jgi:hypothetical protein
MFIMRHMDVHKVPLAVDDIAFNVHNKMHVDYCVQVEMGICGLKIKRRRLMKRFDCTKPKYN